MKNALVALAAALLIVAAGVPTVPLSLAAQGGHGPILVGGPCAYTDHPGTATILAVTAAAPDETAPPYPGLTVTYRFKADQPLPALGAPEEGRTRRLTLTNGWNPGRRFLDKYDIRPGRQVPCVVRIIQSGTCTPVIVEFPGIDRSDYFEAGK